MSRAYLLDIARQIYDKPEVARSGRILPKDVQSRGDLDRLSNTRYGDLDTTPGLS